MLDRSVAPPFVEPHAFVLPPLEKLEIANGRQLFVIHSEENEVLRMEIMFPYAAKWEEEQNGLSFFTYKTLTEGTLSRSSNEIHEYLERFGAFIEVNPGFDVSSIAVYCTPKNFKNVVKVIAEILREPSFPNTELNTLKEIQKQKLAINLEKNSYVATTKFKSLLYDRKDHPYGNSITEHDIDAIKRDQLQFFYQKHIRSSFDIFLTGKVSDQEVKLVEEELGSFKVEELSKIEHENFTNVRGDFSFESKNLLQSSIRIGNHSISRKDVDYFALFLANEILGGYFGSRLMQNIREDKGYTYGIQSSFSHQKFDTVWVIATDVKAEFADATIEEVKKEINILQTRLVPEEELNKVKTYIKGNYLSGITNVFGLSEKYKNLIYYDLDPDFYDRLFDEVDAVNSEKILDVSKKYFDWNSLTIVKV